MNTAAALVKRMRDRRGMALLITLTVLSLLIAVTFQFSRNMRQEYFSASTLLGGQRLKAIAQSGVNIATALLEVDAEQSTHDSLVEPWAMVDSNSFVGLFSQGALQLLITDLSGKLDVNWMVAPAGASQEELDKAYENRVILKSLLLSSSFDIEDEEADQIIDCLVDWIDEDDDEMVQGAESSYYLSLNPPYQAKNGPVETIEELLLVQHISRSLLFGTEGRAGLAEYLTIHGLDGRININTADLELIRAMNSDIDDSILELFDQFRRDEENIDKMGNPTWYKTEVPGWPGYVDLPADNITNSSSFFSISSSGIFHDQQAQVFAVVERDQNGFVSMVYQKME